MERNKKITILFDCDGVLIESAEIKTQAFAKLFEHRPDKVHEIVNYHIKNAGISRHVKFHHIYHSILKQELTEEENIRISRKFSEIVLQQVLDAPLVPGTIEFLEEYSQEYDCFVISGTPEEELKTILAAKGLQPFFQEIIGSPTTKPNAIRSIISRHDLSCEKMVMVGDGASDLLAAEATNVHFVARLTDENRMAFQTQPHCIENLASLKEIIQYIMRSMI